MRRSDPPPKKCYDRSRATFAHVRKNGLHATHHAVEVHVHHLVIQRRRTFLHHRVATHARVVHQHIDATGAFEHLGQSPSGAGVIGHIHLDPLQFHARLGGHRVGLLRLLQPTGGAEHGVAVAGQMNGGGSTDTRVGSGHHRDFAVVCHARTLDA